MVADEAAGLRGFRRRVAAVTGGALSPPAGRHGGLSAQALSSRGKIVAVAVLVLVIGGFAAFTVAERHHPLVDQHAYVRANERVLDRLPVFPGSHVIYQHSDPITNGETNTALGYTTTRLFRLPSTARADDVVAFYRKALRGT